MGVSPTTCRFWKSLAGHVEVTELVPGIRALLTAAETDSALRREIVARGAVAFALGFLLSEAAQKPADEL